MRVASSWIFAWPGLPQAWRRGEWGGMALAVGFAVLLNAALLTTTVWTEVLSPATAKVAWAVVAAAWGMGVWFSWHIWRNPSQAVTDEGRRDLFPAAISEYLQGNWFEAEAACQQMLRDDDHDVDAHLLLATLFRHTGRFDEARRRLEHLATLEGAGKWSLEMADEWSRLRDAQTEHEESGHEEAGQPEAAEVRRAA